MHYLPAKLEQIAQSFETVTASDVQYIDEDIREMKTAAEDLIVTIGDLAQSCRDQKAAIDDLRKRLEGILIDLGVALGTELVETVVLGAIAGALTVGYGAAAVTAYKTGKIADKVRDYAKIITDAVRASTLKSFVAVAKPLGVSEKNMQRIIDLVKKRGDDIKNPVGPGVKTIDGKPLITDRKQIEAKYKHAQDFGVTDPRGKDGFANFEGAVKKHVEDPETLHIDGTYRGNPAILNYNPKTGLVVVQSPTGEFVSGWKLSQAQADNVLHQGKLGGG